MRDLLYLSESKMAALAPQLPPRVRRRLGFDAGPNVGVVSVHASPPAGTPAPVALLDAVVEMIERDRGPRWRADDELRAGDWIVFEEDCYYGAGWPGEGTGDGPAGGLVYYAAAGRPPFLLCGSAAHVLDRRQPAGAGPEALVGRFYTDALLSYLRQVTALPDDAAAGAVPPAEPRRWLHHAVSWLTQVEPHRAQGWHGPVRLSGHARVLACEQRGPGRERWALATPLYVRYAPDA